MDKKIMIASAILMFAFPVQLVVAACENYIPCDKTCTPTDACPDPYAKGDTCYYGASCCWCWDSRACNPCDDYGWCSYKNRDQNRPSCDDVCGANLLKINGNPTCTTNGWTCSWDEYVCDSQTHTNCQSVTCGGTTYYCTFDGSTWQWRTTKPTENTATRCGDNVDNDCDNNTDCQDSDCLTPDPKGDCCDSDDDCSPYTCDTTKNECRRVCANDGQCYGTNKCYCKVCSTSHTSAGCPDGQCCNRGYGGTGIGECVQKGRRANNNRYICDPPTWDISTGSVKNVKESKSIFELLLKFLHSIFL